MCPLPLPAACRADRPPTHTRLLVPLHAHAGKASADATAAAELAERGITYGLVAADARLARRVRGADLRAVGDASTKSTSMRMLKRAAVVGEVSAWGPGQAL